MATTEQILAAMLADPELAKRMNAQQADAEFVGEFAPNLGYTGPIDPSIARWHPLPTTKPTNQRGFQVPQDVTGVQPYQYQSGRKTVDIPLEPGTVNTINVHADNATWSHEYRHNQYPGMSERHNRVLDGYHAQNERDWRNAVGLWKDWMKRKGKNPTDADAERDLVEEIEYGSPTNYRSLHSEVSEEYERQKSGQQSIVPENEVTTENWILDVLSPEKYEFTQGRKRGQYWHKVKQRLDSGNTLESAVDQGIKEASK